MKRMGAALLLTLFLTGCGGNELQRAMDLRTDLLGAQGCSFEAEVTADYGNAIHTFSLSCRGDEKGNLAFEVTRPESISGVAGRISAEGGKLTFDGKAVTFGLLADDQLSPVSAPWILLRTLREGYLTGAGMDGELYHLLARDTYEEDALFLDIWLDSRDIPVRAEILWRDRRILTLELRDFEILRIQ